MHRSHLYMIFLNGEWKVKMIFCNDMKSKNETKD